MLTKEQSFALIIDSLVNWQKMYVKPGTEFDRQIDEALDQLDTIAQDLASEQID